MKEEKNHLKKLFGDFEPDASDARIDEGWEKMRYFLPQEKKRRGAAYLFGCLGIGGVLLLALVASWFIFKEHTYSVATVIKNEKHNGEIFSGTAVKPEMSSASDRNKMPAHKTLPAVKKAEPVQASSTYKNWTAPDKNKAAHKSTDPVKKQADPGSVHEHGSQTLSQPPVTPVMNEPKDALSIADTNRVPATIPDDDYYNPGELLKVIPSETMSTAYLPNILPRCFSPDTGYIAPQLISISPPIDPPYAAFNLMVFGGPDHTQMVLKDLSYGEKKQSGLGASAGLALSYQFKNKISIIGQAVYSESKLTYEHVQVEKRTITPPGQLFINSYDTSLVSTISRVASSSGYNLALGLGYQLYSKARVELTGFALLNWRTVKYTFTEIDSIGVRTAPVNSFGPKLVSLVPVNFPRPVTRLVQTVNTLGITAGATLSYRFYKNLFVIFRPSYCLQLPNDKGAFSDRFLIRRNVLYLDLGLRLKLKRSAR